MNAPYGLRLNIEDLRKEFLLLKESQITIPWAVINPLEEDFVSDFMGHLAFGAPGYNRPTISPLLIPSNHRIGDDDGFRFINVLPPISVEANNDSIVQGF